jgi:hypothetical protein
MPRSNAAELSYTVSVGGQTAQGSAMQILDRIRKDAQNPDIRKLNTSDYAKALVTDASFFLSKGDLAVLEQKHYPTAFDRALEYLAAMPSSSVRILVRNEV